MISNHYVYNWQPLLATVGNTILVQSQGELAMKLVKSSTRAECLSELEKIFQTAIDSGSPLNVLEQARLYHQKKSTNVSLKLVKNAEV